jgi:hypothetical protein
MDEVNGQISDEERAAKRKERQKRIRLQIALLRQQMNKAGNDLEYESLLHRVRDYERLLKYK